MKKIHIGDDSDLNSEEKELTAPVLLTELRQRLQRMAVMTEIEEKNGQVIVRVPEATGTTMYMATGGHDMYCLRNLAYKREVRGTVTLYYIKTRSE